MTTSSSTSTTSSLRTRRRRQQAPSPALRGAAAVLLFTTAVASAAAAGAGPAQQHSCLGFVPTASSSGHIRRPRAAVGAAAPRTGTRLYVGGGGAGNGGAGGNDDKKEELYYQRFLGMNEGEPTDEVRLAAEIADMDPSTIDSLRRGTTPSAPAVQPVAPQPPANPFYGSAGSMDGATPASTATTTTAPQQQPPQQATPFGGVGGAAGGFLNSVKKAATGASVGSGSSFVPLVNGGNDDMLMLGPKAYVIPQDDRETPLEIRSVPTPRRSQKGVIAEVPGRRLPKRPGRVDLGEKMAEVKRSLKEAPTRLTEMQVQNLRNNMGPGGNTATATPPSPNKPAQGGANNKDSNPPFTFPSFPVQLPNAQQQQPPQANKPFTGVGSGSGSGRQRGLKRRGAWGTGMGTGRGPKSSLPAWSRDWRVIIGAIAAVSFLGALFSSLGSRSELIVMNDQGAGVGAAGVADFLLQNAAEIGGQVDKYFV